MKKLIILTALSIIFCAAKAQLSFGPKAGLNIAHVSVAKSSDYSYSSTTRFYGGAFGNYKLSDMFAAQLEILYSGEGEKGKDLSNNNTSDNIKISYLNVPVLFQYKSPVGVYAETGPQVGFLLSIKEKYGDESDQDIKSYYKSVNFSWAFGLGYKLEKYVPGLGINARYTLGLGAINKATVNAGSLKTRAFSFGLFYAFEMK